jgi:hypothetical protein
MRSSIDNRAGRIQGLGGPTQKRKSGVRVRWGEPLRNSSHLTIVLMGFASAALFELRRTQVAQTILRAAADSSGTAPLVSAVSTSTNHPTAINLPS